MGVNLKPCPSCGSDWCWMICDPECGVYEMACNGQDCDCRMCGSSEQEVYDRINRRTPGRFTAAMVEWAKEANDRWARTVDLSVPPYPILVGFIGEHEPAKPEAT